MSRLEELFGVNVFSDEVMQKRLPKDTYKALHKTIADGRPLKPEVANIVACAMRDWAVEKGVTHYTHWFQPMNGVTAEKHDSFISPRDNGKIILEFSGKELVHGESDASSFPSGGLRATFEARGYTAWDPTSYAFIKDGVLCIPTAFCSYSGDALDTKTPLLRSMEALNKQAVRILKLFGRDATRVTSTVGPEQEYFLVDKKLYDRRKDLIFTGRTLFGAKPPKGQELDDHYSGAIKPRVKAFMTELDEELWKLGVLAKTEHNEAAPAQHEMAPIYTVTTLATDHNQLTMEMMKKVALRHGLVCLLHEKPFAGISGSGKHNNWSLNTDSGKNLFSPGKTPYQNARFLLFLAAFIKGVDEYQNLLRCTVAYAGNDHRLGANEAPPAIISIFLGDELNAIIRSIVDGTNYVDPEKGNLRIGVDVLPTISKDTTDRNRTSPLAFTGTKFEFRMLGSSQSISDPNTILNTIMAEELGKFADVLEKAEHFDEALHDLVAAAFRDHQRIIFSGNGYSDDWKKEAASRGLSNFPSTAECLPSYLEEKNIRLVTKHKIFTEAEFRARHAIYTESYNKIVRIEARTTLDMAMRQILPAVLHYTRHLSEGLVSKQALGISSRADSQLLRRVTELSDQLYENCEILKSLLGTIPADQTEAASYFHETVIPAMDAVRAAADALEELTDKSYWPFPTYSDLLFY